MTVLENIIISDKECIEAKEEATAERIRLRKTSRDAIARHRKMMLNDVEQPKRNNDAEKAGVVLNVNKVANSKLNSDSMTLLFVDGKAISEAYKALKLKNQMYANVTINTDGLYTKMSEDNMNMASDNIVPTSSDLESVSVTDVVSKEENGPFKVSTNESSIAHIEKYAGAEESIAEHDKVNVSVVDMEAANAREVSREVPLVAPGRIQQSVEAVDAREHDGMQPPKAFNFVKEETQTEKPTEPAHIPTTDFNGDSLEELREGLAETVKLQDEVAQAQSKEAQAKENAMRAEQEAAATHNKLLETVQMLTAHKEALKAQAAMSVKQASIYEAQYGDYTAEKDEYEKMINDMLAVMGNNSEKEETHRQTR